MKENNQGAAVKFPPPLVFLCVLIAAYITHYYWPISLYIPSVFTYIGAGIAILGLLMILSISSSFKHNKTNIEPWKPTTTIITTGFYAYSRNPIYIGFCLIPIGTGIYSNSFWVLISFLPSIFLVYLIAVKKEEIYLEHQFGEDYLHYKTKVRRWL